MRTCFCWISVSTPMRSFSCSFSSSVFQALGILRRQLDVAQHDFLHDDAVGAEFLRNDFAAAPANLFALGSRRLRARCSWGPVPATHWRPPAEPSLSRQAAAGWLRYSRAAWDRAGNDGDGESQRKTFLRLDTRGTALDPAPFLPSSSEPVVKSWSRVSKSSTLSSNGATKCTPGYSVPASVPLVWLTRTPAMPLGTTTMLNASKTGAQASNPKARAVPSERSVVKMAANRDRSPGCGNGFHSPDRR